MTKNVGVRDANVRITISMVLVLVALFVVKDQYLRIVLTLFGAVLAGTAYFHTCWLYTLMGKNTCEPEPLKHEDVTPPASEEKSV